MSIRKGLIQALYSNIEIEKCTIKGNTGVIGVLIQAYRSSIILSGCSFIKNVVVSTGATILIEQSSLSLNGIPRNIFTLNSAPYGGVLSCENSTISLTGYNRFTKNSAIYYGGAFYLGNSRVVISGITLNRAMHGGAVASLNIDFQYTNENLHEEAHRNKSTISQQLYFIANTAEITGGAMLVSNDNEQWFHTKMLISSGQFLNNSAGECGGAMHLTEMKNVTTKNVAITGNRGTAICTLDQKYHLGQYWEIRGRYIL